MNSIDVKTVWRRLPVGIGALAFLLSMLFLAARAVAMFGPLTMQPLLPLMCIGMLAVPWLLLSAHGRYQIGLKRPTRASYYLTALASGATAAALCFAIGYGLFGAGPENWFVSVARVYRSRPTTGMSLLQLHLMFTIAACLFSPLGEEIFFRGFLQKVLEQRWSRRTSTHIEAGFFALVHLCHHGVLATAAGWVLMPGSAALWVALMFGLAWMFAWLRRASDSVLPAIVAHAAFNALMNVFIFAFLWNK